VEKYLEQRDKGNGDPCLPGFQNQKGLAGVAQGKRITTARKDLKLRSKGCSVRRTGGAETAGGAAFVSRTFNIRVKTEISPGTNATQKIRD